MPSTVADDNLPPVVMPACEERRILAGQKALVTGGSSGIGRAVALALGGAGADVVVNYRSGADEAQEVVSAIGTRACAIALVEADVSEVEDQVQDAVRPDVRGVRHDRHPGRERRPAEGRAFEQMTLQDWNTVLDVNLTGQFLCAREAVKEFKRTRRAQGGAPARGKIICMSSVHDVIPWAGHVNYAPRPRAA